MKYAYFPGCSLSSTGVEYDLSTRAVAKVLGIELWEIPEWNCCGATGAHLTNHALALGLPARNMAIAEAEGLDVAIPCAACYSRSKAVEMAVTESEEDKELIEKVIERKYEGNSKARALLDIFANDLGVETIGKMVTKNLNGIKVACYYGCLLVRPTKYGIDDAENPMMMDHLMNALGAKSIDWAFKTECCGAAHTACRPEAGVPMTGKIIENAIKNGADCIVSACPMCMNNLDMRQTQAGINSPIPVYYFTELIGLALGIEPKEMGFNRHFVDGMQIVNKIAANKAKSDGGEE